MNKIWIEHSQRNAIHSRRYLRNDYGDGLLSKHEYLDIMGLFETCWITYDFAQRYHQKRYEYGYSCNE